MVDYARSRAVADRQIRRWGQKSLLRRASGDRDCWALEVQISANERRALKNPTNRVYIISAVDLTVPPDTKADSLVWDNGDGTERVFRNDAPVAPFSPGGVIIYYELQVQG
jgi:hypothetical protein